MIHSGEFLPLFAVQMSISKEFITIWRYCPVNQGTTFTTFLRAMTNTEEHRLD
jgi:hypothetical protein